MSAPPIPFYDSEEEEADERRAALKRYLELDLGDDTCKCATERLSTD